MQSFFLLFFWFLLLLLDWEIFWLPHFGVKLIVRARWLRREILEELHKFVNSHLANTLSIARSDINLTSGCLLFSCHKNIVPLVKLSISDLLVELGIRTVKFYFKACIVQVKHNTMAILEVLLRDWDNNSLSG